MKNITKIFSASCASLLVSFSGAAQNLVQEEKPTQVKKSHRKNVDEIIEVVAQKRVENIQTVPVAISVVTPADIETTGYKQLNELSEFVPNMRMSVTNDFTSIISLRGVGAASRSIGFDSRVGLYLDGVYLGQSPSNNQDIFDNLKKQLGTVPNLYFSAYLSNNSEVKPFGNPEINNSGIFKFS